jgi:hypothetical protein
MWRVFPRGVFALPLEGKELDLYRRRTGRKLPSTALPKRPGSSSDGAAARASRSA